MSETWIEVGVAERRCHVGVTVGGEPHLLGRPREEDTPPAAPLTTRMREGGVIREASQ